MSRTYRKHQSWKYYYGGNVIPAKSEEWSKIWNNLPFSISMGVTTKDCIIDKDRDVKPWDKPDKTFKQMKRREERAKVKNALRNDKEIPFFKKTDQWDWT